MVKLEVITLNRYKDTLLTYLHEAGAVEVREVKVELAQKDTPNEYHRKAASYSISMSRLVEFLGTYRKAAGGGASKSSSSRRKSRREHIDTKDLKSS